MDPTDDFVNVSVRIRPCLKGDSRCIKIISNDPAVIFIADRELTYSFDNVFTEKSNQEQVYSEIVEPLIEKVMSGFNCTVFAYGQTGTGKTYTMGSNLDNVADADAGIIARTFNTFFSKDDESREIDLQVSFYEIYNEKVYDLLGDNKIALQVKGFNIINLKKEVVYDSNHAKYLLTMGGKNRHTGETKQNSSSSRSHAIFTIYCTVRNENEGTEAKLNLVDLAGSESAKKSGNEGHQLHEGININKGLLSVGQVINALSLNRTYIPYRQSMITTILQDALNKRNYVTLVACVSPNTDDLHETVRTLEFAQRAKKVKSKVELNNIVVQYTKEFTRSVKKTKPLSNIIGLPGRGCTPLKRLGTIFHTSTEIKKPKVTNSTIINCPNADANNVDDSIISMNFSSVSSIHDPLQNISPVVRKCIDAVETSIMNKLSVIIKESICQQTPVTRKSISRISLNSLHTTVSQLVRNELNLYTGNSSTITHSSPLLDDDENITDLKKATVEKHVAKQLNFNDGSPVSGSPVNRSSDRVLQEIFFNQIESPYHIKNISKRVLDVCNIEKATKVNSMNNNSTSDTFVFKVPKGIPKQAKKVKSHEPITPKKFCSGLSLNQKCLSPINILYKNGSMDSVDNRKLDNSLRKPALKRNTPRRSIRLSLKKITLSHNVSLEDSLEDISFNTGVNRSRKVQQVMRQNSGTPPRRSNRLSMKETPTPAPRAFINNKIKSKPAPKPAPRKTIKRRPSRKATTDGQSHLLNSHAENVLKILNTGNIMELQKFATIGKKTAEQILLYRKFRGKFQDISDLSYILSRGQLYRRFIKSNFLDLHE